MKKFLNRALLFQWFYISKWLIGVLLVIWSGFIYFGHIDSINSVSSEISSFTNNNIVFSIEMYQILIIIAIFLVFLFTKGVSKRNKYTFLISGPFNKKKMYINDLIALTFTLILFIIAFMYISGCIYIKYSNDLYLVNGYWIEVLLSSLRVGIIGFAFIVYLILFDFMFSNIILTGAALIGVPTLIVLNITAIIEQFNIVFINGSRSLLSDLMMLFLKSIEAVVFRRNLDFHMYEASNKYLFFGLTIIIACVIIGLISIDKLSKKIRIETMNKIFSFPWVERSMVILMSLSVAQFIFLIMLNTFIYGIKINYIQSYIIAFIPSIIIFVLSYKLTKYIIKLVA